MISMSSENMQARIEIWILIIHSDWAKSDNELEQACPKMEYKTIYVHTSFLRFSYLNSSF
jgi:hypothetical protein